MINSFTIEWDVILITVHCVTIRLIVYHIDYVPTFSESDYSASIRKNRFIICWPGFKYYTQN
jgi:hypothetical protein